MLDGELQPIYQNLPVAPQIAPFVRRYVFIDAPGDLKDYVRPAPLGYNYVGHLFRGNVLFRVNGEEGIAGPGFYFTTQNESMDVESRYTGGLGYMMAELYPTTMYRLFGVPVGRQKGLMAPWADLLGANQVDVLTDGLRSASTRDQRKAAFDMLFREMIATARPPVPKIDAAVKLIGDTQGRIKIAELCDRLSMTPRSLSRRFRHMTGFTPKFYTRIVQLHATLGKINADDQKTLSDVALENGYFDQAHFIRTVHEFFGFTPRTYRDLADPLFHACMGRDAFLQDGASLCS